MSDHANLTPLLPPLTLPSLSAMGMDVRRNEGLIIFFLRSRSRTSAVVAVPCTRSISKALSSRAWRSSNNTNWSTRSWKTRSRPGTAYSWGPRPPHSRNLAFNRNLPRITLSPLFHTGGIIVYWAGHGIRVLGACRRLMVDWDFVKIPVEMGK